MTEENNLEKMLKKSFGWLAIASACLIVSGCSTPKIKSLSDEETTPTQVKSTNQLTIREGQFVPDKISVRAGDEVIFTNEDNTPCIIASDPHPEHDQLPDLYSSPIYEGKSYNYVFKERGYFGVHLEGNPSIKAQIIVLSSRGDNNVNK